MRCLVKIFVAVCFLFFLSCSDNDVKTDAGIPDIAIEVSVPVEASVEASVPVDALQSEAAVD